MFFRNFRNKINVETLNLIDAELGKIQDLDILLERILLEARKIVNADAGTIYIKEQVEEEGILKEKLAMKYSQNDTLQKELPAGQKLIYSLFSVPIDDKTISGYCGQTKQLINIPDAYNLPSGVPYSFGKAFDEKTGYKTTSMLNVPLTSASGELLGVIQIINAKDMNGKTIPFSKNCEHLITHFANDTCEGLQKAKWMRTMVLRLIKMAELRDPKETGTHVNRVAGYAVEIWDCWANRKALSEDEKDKIKDSLRIASMLHDAGKVAISDAILKKPSKFTPEEFEIMKNHTIFGSALFDDPQSPLDVLSRDIAFTHHENWDGTGYPGWVDPLLGTPLKTGADGKTTGKKGNEIPIAGRIVALADVFDALCSRRVYKEPWTESDVLEEIQKLSGTKFDPELVDIFFEVYPNIKQIQQRYPELG
ncbi:MAG: HD domain-containing protein [Treponema sp.]|nr:HD domain-containing protein [Treponema sp.]